MRIPPGTSPPRRARNLAAPGRVPLGRALSKLGILSRSRAIAAIRAGRVRVNGRTVVDPAALVVPERVRIALDDQPRRRAAWRTILLYKPRGVVTTRRDPQGRRTVFDVLRDAPSPLTPAEIEPLIAVGRLDLATSGLLLLTTDTRLAQWISDPENQVRRLYVVTVRGRVTEEMAGRMPAAVRVVKASNRETHLVVELHEGKNRQVRRLFDAIARPVSRLKRAALGGIELGSLEPGGFRELSPGELERAFPGAPATSGA